MSTKSQAEEVVEFLKTHPGVKYSTKQIAQELINLYPEKYAQKQVLAKRFSQLSPTEKIVEQIRAEISAHKKLILSQAPDHLEILLNNSGTLEFSYKLESKRQPETMEESSSQEKDMYNPFIDYLKNEFDYTIFGKRIEEKQTKKEERGKFKWMHPDIVGIQRIGEDLCEETMEISRMFPNGGNNKETIKLWSFEVKKKITISNIRESFFQTLSNSSWAHFAYLVFEEIDESAVNELEFLCSTYGVGAIRFEKDSDKDTKHRTIHYAKERPEINWAFVDKLISQDKGANKTFKEFMVLVKNFVKTGYLDNTKTWTEWLNQE